ncbi:MAG: hypothetical protein ACR2LZ_05290 [Pyrinomonadaceae bacterium]
MIRIRFRHLSAVLCVLAVLLIVAGDAAAQDRYRKKYNKKQVDNIIRQLESSSNDFRRNFDRALDRSRIDGTEREDNFNSRVRRFEESLNTLRGEFNRRDDWWESRNNVQQMLEAARPVSVMMNNRRLGGNLESQWRRLRRNVNKLAGTFNLPLV